MRSLTSSSLRYYRATNAMVVVGVAVAVAVLAGALLVGASVRESLRELALSRLGATDLVVSSTTFFRTALADDIATRASQPRQSPLGNRLDVYRVVRATVPLVVLDGAVVHDQSRRTAGRVVVYGIDERFGRFHGVEGFSVSSRDAMLSRALAEELGAKAGDSVTVRVARPTDVPLSVLQGRREMTGRRIRVTVARVLEPAALGEFALVPSQGPVLAIYVPMGRLQRDLDLGDRVNTMLVSLTGDALATDAVAVARGLIAPVATVDDLGLRLRRVAGGDAISVESRAGLMTPAVVDAMQDQAQRDHRAVVPALTYVVNSIRHGDRSIPYSTVTAIDLDAYNRLVGPLGPDATHAGPAGPVGRDFSPATSPRAGPAGPVGRDFSPATSPGTSSHPPIWLNEWAADDLGARVGDDVSLDYFLWSDAEGLETATAAFSLQGIVPMAGIGGDRTLTPDYPGISDATDITTWDPPFPVELARVRPKDEDYWDRWRAAPKAIIPLLVGQRLWGSRFGAISSLRVAQGAAAFSPDLDPFIAGFSARDARSDARAAAEGTTDFGEYFLYFSFFLVVSALLLVYLFFALGLEQRTREVGVLAAVGFTPAAIRRSFLREGAVLASIGAAIGALAAIGYGAFIMHGLRTWWVGAVGTTSLQLHVAPAWLALGVVAAFVAGLLAVWLGVRGLGHRSARSLLTGAPDAGGPKSGRVYLLSSITIALAALGSLLIGAATTGTLNATVGFFGAGGAWLVASLCATALLVRRRRPSKPLARGPLAMCRLGLRQGTAQPARTVLSLALIAFACFVLVSVGAFQRDASGVSLDRASGTGGFALMAESVAPLMHDPTTSTGRDALGLDPDDPSLQDVEVARFRLRPGDEASCLSLYKPANPRIISPEPRFLATPRFTFSSSMASTPQERDNPWRLLDRVLDDGAVPAIADQTTLAYVFHLKVGDTFTFQPDGHTSVRLRIVGALADSLLQSELVIGESAFVRLFPRNEGYPVWLIDAPVARAAALAAHLEDQLSDFGFDVVDTRQRLASYHRVENTYLATFQALGALGLLLGTVGLGAVLARNVLERRREIGLLGAVGFTPGNVRMLVLSESLALVIGGLLVGTGSALVAIFPALVDRAQALPLRELGGVLAAVVLTGVVASLFAVRVATAMPVVAAIKSE